MADDDEVVALRAKVKQLQEQLSKIGQPKKPSQKEMNKAKQMGGEGAPAQPAGGNQKTDNKGGKEKAEGGNSSNNSGGAQQNNNKSGGPGGSHDGGSSSSWATTRCSLV